MMTDMKVRAIAPWFGGKRTMAADIVRQLGRHTQYFEPFCGSMAVVFQKPPSQKETVNDLHGGLICLARVLSDELAAPQLYHRLQATLFSEDLLEESRVRLEAFGEPPWWLQDAKHGENPNCRRADANMLEYAYWYFLASWMGRNGTAGTERVDYQIAVRWTKNGGSPTVRWKNAVESIPAWHRRLLNVVILRRNAFKILDRFEDCPESAIYCDPPYLPESRSGFRFGPGSDHKYVHEFSVHKESTRGNLFDSDPDDHERLAKLLRRYRKARIVVSYYDCPRVRELYDGWTFLDLTRRKHLHAANKKPAAAKEAPELLIVNGPVYE